jgi:preprotein translocase subunit SecE
MIHTLIYVLVVCIVIGLVYWVADFVPIPDPLNKLIKVVAIVVGVIAIIYALLGIAGVPMPT